MNSIQDVIDLIGEMPMWIPVLFIIIAFMALIGQWALYEKCDLPGYAAVVPVWNVIIFLKIVGRPSKHGWMVMTPPLLMMLPLILWNMEILGMIPALAIVGVIFIPWAYFLIVVYKEICQCFGKNDIMSYILIVLFNGLYLFNLALSQDEKYRGPVYKG